LDWILGFLQTLVAVVVPVVAAEWMSLTLLLPLSPVVLSGVSTRARTNAKAKTNPVRINVAISTATVRIRILTLLQMYSAVNPVIPVQVISTATTATTPAPAIMVDERRRGTRRLPVGGVMIPLTSVFVAIMVFFALAGSTANWRRAKILSPGRYLKELMSAPALCSRREPYW